MRSLVTLFPHVLLPLAVVVSGIAIWKGRGPERMGGTAMIVTLALQFLFIQACKLAGVPFKSVVMYQDIALCLVLGAWFLCAALKFNSPWLGFAFLVQGAELAVTSYYMGVTHRTNYYFALNLMTFLIVVLLAIATVQSIFRRRSGPFTQHELQGARILSVIGR